MNRIALVALALLAAAAPMTAQTSPAGVRHVEEPVVTPSCAFGVRYDDQSFETMYRLDGPGQEAAVMRFQLPDGTTSLDQACVCFSRSAGAPANASFSLLVYDNDGPSGSPGTLIAQIPATANAIPVFPSRAFYSLDLSAGGLVLPGTTVYVGAMWNSGFAGDEGVYFCGDRTATTTPRRIYVSEGSGFQQASDRFGDSAPRAIGVRVDTNLDNPGICFPDATAACINQNRFRVSATFQVGDGAVNPAHVVALTSDTAYLWFFDPANVEAMVKVVDGCTVNSRYWVFGGGMTNVRVVITVTDVQTGVTRQFVNPQDTPFQPIQRTDAFATCP